MLQRLQEQARKRQRTAAEVIDLTGDEGESNANRRRRSDTENASGSRRQQGSPCFHLLRVEGNPRQPPCLSTTLQDLVSQGENLKKALVSNFLIDTGWLVQQFPTLMHCEELIVAHDGRCQVDQAGLSGSKAARHSSLVVHAPELPSYGTHHSKFFVLFYDTHLRLIIHTANLIPKDCTHKTQGVWHQDFKLKTALSSSVGSSPSSCAFEEDLVDYLEQLKFPLKCKDSLLASVRRFDFSTTEACLVASVPGTHRERERKVGKYGHMALRRHLEKQTFDERFKNSPLIYQFSSMGSLSEKWLREEFTESCSAGLYLEKDGGPRRKFFLGKPKDLSKDIHLIWPTVDEVRLSSEGYGAGASLPGYMKNIGKDFLQCHYRKWDGARYQRQRAMPHIKMYTRYATGSSGNDAPTFAWVVLGSHNLSKAAWGWLQKNGSQLKCLSFELGVLLLPPRGKCYQMWEPSLPSSTDAPPPSVCIPYAFPPTPYQTTRDRPWTVDTLYEEPDVFGLDSMGNIRVQAPYTSTNTITNNNDNNNNSGNGSSRRRKLPLREEDLPGMSIGNLKKWLTEKGIDLKGCLEKKDLIEKAKEKLLL